MKKIFLFLAMALVSVFAVAQTSHYNQVVWLNGRMMYANPVPAIDSITYTYDAAEQDTLHLLLPRTMVRVVHDTVMVIQKDTVYINTCEEGNNKAIGAFYVSADKQVAFAPGNLQYTQSANTWSFAEHQYDVIGNANVIDSSALADKIDLFGWSASGIHSPFGVGTSVLPSFYGGGFVDWGTNTIGNDAPDTWRTLTSAEWEYLFKHTHWTMAKVNDILGFMLLPTDFTAPSGMTVAVIGNGNISAKSFQFKTSDYASNVYTADQFAQLESLGCVFLPCAGLRNGLDVSGVGSYGCYWSTTEYDGVSTRLLNIYTTDVRTSDLVYRSYGQSVRLVQDLK